MPTAESAKIFDKVPETRASDAARRSNVCAHQLWLRWTAIFVSSSTDVVRVSAEPELYGHFLMSERRRMSCDLGSLVSGGLGQNITRHAFSMATPMEMIERPRQKAKIAEVSIMKRVKSYKLISWTT